MPDPHYPDHLDESRRAEIRRLEHQVKAYRDEIERLKIDIFGLRAWIKEMNRRSDPFEW